MNRYEILSEAELLHIGNELLQKNSKHRIFAFYGKMGAGKTTFIKVICNLLGSADTVTSPTFAIINEYKTSSKDILYHFDFYRLEKQEEIFDLGYEDYFYSSKYCFIEWPEKIEELLPPDTVKVSIEETDEGIRVISWQ